MTTPTARMRRGLLSYSLTFPELGVWIAFDVVLTCENVGEETVLKEGSERLRRFRGEERVLKVLTVIGTRPEAIKMAPVIKELERYEDRITSRVCVTGQHREMLDQVLDLFEIYPDCDLNLMRNGETLTRSLSTMLTAFEPVLTKERPDWVLVQGDTTTVAAASLAASYQQVMVGHVEAGLRTHDRRNPFPEENNRRIASAITDLHFAPTPAAEANLLQEHISKDTVMVTGNTVIDALAHVSTLPFDIHHSELQSIPLDKRIITVTAHRRENLGKPLRDICTALRLLVERNPDVHVVYAVHRNPRVWSPVHELLGNVPGITLLPPLGYLDMVHLLIRSYMVLTDSGGLQEEAPCMGIPVLVLRETTERPEVLRAGVARLVGTDVDSIVLHSQHLLNSVDEYKAMASSVNLYGDGTAAQRIVARLLRDVAAVAEPVATPDPDIVREVVPRHHSVEALWQ